jgi:peptidoglycan-associated lipoprotein
MMDRRSVWLTAMALLMAIGVAACANRVEPPPAPPPAPAPPAPAAPPPPPPPPPPPAATAKPAPPPPPRALTEDEIFARKTLDEINAEMPLGDVFFDYDMSTVREDQRASLQRNADWMRRWTSTRVSVEGHTDARGTNEYNIALGQRRGDAVRQYLVGLGIAADRLVVVTKGEESPQCTEEAESCWSRNRRGHFVVTAK